MARKIVRKKKVQPESAREAFSREPRKTGTPRSRVEAYVALHKEFNPKSPHIHGLTAGGKHAVLYRDDIEAILKEKK